MDSSILQKANEYLNRLIGQPMLYAIKSPDVNLYDFGFGELVEVVGYRGQPHEVGLHTLHAQCRFRVIWRKNERKVFTYYEDTPSEKFHSEIGRLIGQKVKRVVLSDKNDLWLEFGDGGECWVVFATFENDEESWRFFTFDEENLHLVAADSWMEFVGDESSTDLQS